jgi:hypothetical protein
MFSLIDAVGDVIWIGSYSDCKELSNILIAEPHEVTEEMEVKWEFTLRYVEFAIPLKIKEVEQ